MTITPEVKKAQKENLSQRAVRTGLAIAPAAQHTPGPWKVASETDTATAIYDNDGNFIASALNKNIPTNEAKANARLIAAAPETARERDEALNILKDILSCAPATEELPEPLFLALAHFCEGK